MPPVSTGLILLKIFGRRSPLGQWLYERGIEIVFNWKGVLIAMSVMSFPLLVRSVRTSFAEVNPRLEQIAATLGASPLRIFFVITIPLAYKGIVAGALLAFSRALGEFGATILLAGNIPGETQTLSLAIYNFVQMGKDSEALRAAWNNRRTGIPVRLVLGVAAALGKKGVTCCCAAAYRWRILNWTSTCPSMPVSRRSSGRRVRARRRCSTPSPACATIAAGEIEIDGQMLFSSAQESICRRSNEASVTSHRRARCFPHLSVRTKYSLRRRARQSRPADRRGFNANMCLNVLEIGGLLDRPVTKLQAAKRSESRWPERSCPGRDLLLLDEPSGRSRHRPQGKNPALSRPRARRI